MTKVLSNLKDDLNINKTFKMSKITLKNLQNYRNTLKISKVIKIPKKKKKKLFTLIIGPTILKNIKKIKKLLLDWTFEIKSCFYNFQSYLFKKFLYNLNPLIPIPLLLIKKFDVLLL